MNRFRRNSGRLAILAGVSLAGCGPQAVHLDLQARGRPWSARVDSSCPVQERLGTLRPCLGERAERPLAKLAGRGVDVFLPRHLRIQILTREDPCSTDSTVEVQALLVDSTRILDSLPLASQILCLSRCALQDGLRMLNPLRIGQEPYPDWERRLLALSETGASVERLREAMWLPGPRTLTLELDWRIGPPIPAHARPLLVVDLDSLRLRRAAP